MVYIYLFFLRVQEGIKNKHDRRRNRGRIEIHENKTEIWKG